MSGRIALAQVLVIPGRLDAAEHARGLAPCHASRRRTHHRRSSRRAARVQALADQRVDRRVQHLVSKTSDPLSASFGPRVAPDQLRAANAERPGPSGCRQHSSRGAQPPP